MENFEEIKKFIMGETDCLDLLVVYKYTHELLNKYLGTDYNFPIDIEKIINQTDIEMYEQPLNLQYDTKYLASFLFIRKNILSGKTVITLINDDKKITTNRYLSANQLGVYLLNHDKELLEHYIYFEPNYYVDRIEFFADVFATFILLPPDIVLQKFNNFLEPDIIERKEKMQKPEYSRHRPQQEDFHSINLYLKHLVNEAVVDYETAVSGYQYIKQLCATLDNKENEQEECIQKIIKLKNEYKSIY